MWTRPRACILITPHWAKTEGGDHGPRCPSQPLVPLSITLESLHMPCRRYGSVRARSRGSPGWPTPCTRPVLTLMHSEGEEAAHPDYPTVVSHRYTHSTAPILDQPTVDADADSAHGQSPAQRGGLWALFCWTADGQMMPDHTHCEPPGWRVLPVYPRLLGRSRRLTLI
jgi:hypothetical protein